MVLGFYRVLPVLTWSKLFLLYLFRVACFCKGFTFPKFSIEFSWSNFVVLFSFLFFIFRRCSSSSNLAVHHFASFAFLFPYFFFLLLSNRWIVSIENGRRVLSAASINSTRPLSLRRWGVDLYLGPGVVFGLFFFVSALPDVVFSTVVSISFHLDVENFLATFMAIDFVDVGGARVVSTGNYWVLPSFTRFVRSLPSFTEFTLVLPSCTGFLWVTTGFT